MKQKNTEALQKLVGEFLVQDVEALEAEIGRLPDSENKQVGRQLAKSMDSEDMVMRAIPRLRSLPQPVLEGFLLDALYQNRDWVKYLSDVPSTTTSLRPILLDAASQNIRNEQWWTNWKNIVIQVATQKSPEAADWAADLLTFLQKASIPVDMADVRLVLSQVASKPASKFSSSGKKNKKSPKGEGLADERDAIVAAVNNLYEKFTHEQLKWKEQRAHLLAEIDRLEKERDDREKRLSELTDQFETLKQERDELGRQREQLRDEITTYKAQNRSLQNELQVMTGERDKLKSDIVLWERTAEAQRHQAEQAREQTTLEFRHRLRKNVVPLAAYVRDRAEQALHTFLSHDVRLMVAQFDQLHEEILKEAELPQEGRISPVLLDPPKEDVHE